MAKDPVSLRKWSGVHAVKEAGFPLQGLALDCPSQPCRSMTQPCRYLEQQGRTPILVEARLLTASHDLEEKARTGGVNAARNWRGNKIT